MINYYIEKNLVTIKRFAAIHEDENYRFRAFLKRQNSAKVDATVLRLNKEITPKIDCTLCGNCCNLQPVLAEEEIETLAKLENITSEEYMEKYCAEKFGDIYLYAKPCHYLAKTGCSIYGNRPEECRAFPCTDKKGFTSRLLEMINRYEVCPIVYNLMERLKDEMGFRRR
ncbi:MAG: YkgJ family cysteine cluster protein [Prevotellaceae bacterium]|jgi:Fe-S-cluster containining protein|nr:YkgJ family cysteine cluster protein [Prevotellaceae bacterium]